MSKQEKQALANALKKQLEETQQMWKENRSPAFMVGYLQGLIKQTIVELES